MIAQRNVMRKFFYAVCASCGDQAPYAINESDAHTLALSDGWKCDEKNVGGELIKVYTCNECVEKAS